MLALLSAQLCLVPALASVSLGKRGNVYIGEPGALRSVDPKGSELWKVTIDVPNINGSFCNAIADEPKVVEGTDASGTVFATVGSLPLDISCGPNGIYVSNSIVALDQLDGSLKWNVSLPCLVKGGSQEVPFGAGAPVVSGNVVYVHVAAHVSHGDGYVVALDAVHGGLLWNVSTGATRFMLDPLVLPHGTILLPGINGSKGSDAHNGTHLALWPNGTVKWQRQDLGCYPASHKNPWMVLNSTIYVVSADECKNVVAPDRTLFALAEEDGRILWSQSVSGAEAPVVAERSGMVYVYSYPRSYGSAESANVSAFNINGEFQWIFDMGLRPPLRMSPTSEFAVFTGEDGVDTLYFSNTSVLLAVKKGEKLWEVDLMNGSVCDEQYCSFSAPTAAADGTVLAFGGGKDVPRAMHAIHDGERVWTLEQAASHSFQSPVMDQNLVTYVPEGTFLRPGHPGGVQVSAVDSSGSVLWVHGAQITAVV